MLNRVPSYFLWLAAFLVISTVSDFPLGAKAYASQEQEPEEAVPAPPAPQARQKVLQVKTVGESASRDSLRREIEHYSRAIDGLRDSLELDRHDFQLSEEQRLRVEQSIDDLTKVLEGVGGELSNMELEIINNRISLLDDQGEGIVIDIPENLDEQLSQGFELLQKIILSELPESQNEEIRNSWSWGTGKKKNDEPDRTILKGNIVKVWDNLQITEDEDVRGDVVLVFGDGEITGRVDGDVITVFGNLRLDENAEITGQVVSIGGRLDQDHHAEVGDVVVVDPFPGFRGGGFNLSSRHGILGLLMGLGELILVVLMTILVLAITPRNKLEKITAKLTQRPLACLGIGLFGSLTLLLLGIVLIGVLVVTVIGIPVALLVLVAILLLSVLSIGLVGMALGRRICTLLSGSCNSDWMPLLLGLLLLNSVSLLGQFAGLFPDLSTVADVLVVVGSGVKMAAYWIGMGSLLTSRFGRN
jgi:hypothetical protein